ncbi:MAG: chromosomal replication initiator protein DnaA [Planctomycetota bacterium]|nr:chromosomal replication initiator protein DnaA [Planctomycetota bacterium]
MGRPDPQTRDAILAHLRRTYPTMCRRWFDDIVPVALAGGTLQLLVREPVQLKYLQKRCQRQFTEAAQAITGRLLAVRFVGEEELEQGRRASAANGTARDNAGVGVGASEEEMLISPDYSFDNFIIGPGNRLAHAAAVAVAQKPGWAYNPFFVHGGVGLGKTHLLQAICQAASRATPGLSIYYVSCNGFMTQFLSAVQAGEMSQFRQRFRNVDILLIDDVHDLSSRDRTQEEFFHTFNSLYQAGKQIVVSSDAAPKDIPDLEERIISRFNCGLVADVQQPGFETRVAILKSKAGLRQLSLPDDVAAYIAERIDTNVRELEGAITKIQGLSNLNGSPIDVDLAKLALGDQVGSKQAHLPTIQEIIETVTHYYGVKPSELLSKRRHKSIALPRQICMWLARKHTRHSLEEIGGYFGGRDHTTVMHAVKAVKSKRQGDGSLDHDVNALERQLLAISA